MGSLSSTVAEIRARNQMRLPPVDRIAVTKMCLARHPEEYTCTKQADHEGDHVAHGSLGTIIERWSAAINI